MNTTQQVKQWFETAFPEPTPPQACTQAERMKLYTIRPLEWNKQAKNNWVCEGISYLYTTQPEHHRIRLYCSKKGSNERAELYDFDSYHDMMHFVTEHNERAALRYLKEFINEPPNPA